jgi:hypothetical protein
MDLIVTPIHEILWHITKEKKPMPSFIVPESQACERLNGQLPKKSLKLCTPNPNIHFGICIKHIDLLLEKSLFVLHDNKLTFSIRIITYALW